MQKRLYMNGSCMFLHHVHSGLWEMLTPDGEWTYIECKPGSKMTMVDQWRERQ